MGALDYKTRRHRRNRLAAELAATYGPRRHFRLGTDIGWHWQFDDPNTLYRRRNLLTYSEDFSNAAWYKYNSASGSGKVLTLVADNSYIQSAPTGPATLLRPGLTVTLRGVITSSHTQTIRTGIGDAVDGNPLVQTVHSLVAGVPTECVQTLLLNSNFGTSACAQILGIAGSSVPGSTLTINELQLEVGGIPTTYQPVPTTWAQAYLDAVGAERIYAWADTAGTDPVTAVGEGIGLLLGREYGGVRGVELVTSPVGHNGWTPSGTGGVKIVSGSLGSLYQVTSITAGVTYEVVIVVSAISGTLTPQVGNTTSTTITTTGTHRRFITPTAGITCYIDAPAATTATVTSWSIRAVPGTHLTQATGTAKPTLSARVNLATATEVVANALPWGCNNYTIENNSLATGLAKPAFLTKVTALASSSITAYTHIASATNFRVSFLLASPGTRVGALSLLIRNSTTATNLLSSSMNSAGAITSGVWTSSEVAPGVFRATVNVTSGVSIGDTVLVYWGSTSVSTTGDYWYVGGMDIRTADDAAKNIPAYQRVGATAADHDTDGYPHFAEGDGTDNAWASVATVDGSGSDKVTVVAAVTKNSDAAAGCVLELTANSGSTTNSFGMFAPSSAAANFNFGSHGSASVVQVTETGPASPKTAVLGGYADITGDSVVLARDGVSVASSSTDQGTGNFANATLYVLSRGGSSVRFNGRFYGSTGRFGPMSDSERNNLTRWWQKRIGTA